jgi:hypothetical protein
VACLLASTWLLLKCRPVSSGCFSR